MKPRVAIVYLSYNGKKYLDEVLAALRALDYPADRLELIFVDNASQDGSCEYLREVKGITFFPNAKNSGFAEGNNIGIRHAMLHGADYVFLHNNDLKLAPDAVTRAVALAEQHPDAGSVQSLVRYWKHPEVVNVSGGMVHFLGMGYARDNGRALTDVLRERTDGEEIAYASGAAVLYRVSALERVGLLDPFLFLYHEDLELGWRLRLAGFRNLLSTQSHAFHDYEFKRSVTKFFWMERNRWLVHFSHLRLRTLALLLPFLIALEFPLLLFALTGGWLREKLLVYRALLSPACWVYVWHKRRNTRALRTISDRTIMTLFTSKIEHQETDNVIVRRIGNPVLTRVWLLLQQIIRW